MPHAPVLAVELRQSVGRCVDVPVTGARVAPGGGAGPAVVGRARVWNWLVELALRSYWSVCQVGWSSVLIEFIG